MTRHSPAQHRVCGGVFTPDPDLPADHQGRRTCRCGLLGEPGDAPPHGSGTGTGRPQRCRRREERGVSLDFPPGWLVAVAVAIGNGKAEPEDLRAASRVLEALRREGALRSVASERSDTDA